DSTNLQVNLLKQLSNMNQINLFELSLEELEAYHDYLRTIKKYADNITRTA
ncbi:TPA: antitoxin epsilon, partial [Enterococcus faecalis]